MKPTIDVKLALAAITADSVMVNNFLEARNEHALCGFESMGDLENFLDSVSKYAKEEYGEEIPATFEGMEGLKEIYNKLSTSLKDMLDTKNLIKGNPFTIKLSIDRFESNEWKNNYQIQEQQATIFVIPAYHNCKNIKDFSKVINTVTSKIDRNVNTGLSTVCSRSKKGIEIFKEASKLKQKELYSNENVDSYLDNVKKVDEYIAKEIAKLPKELEVTESGVLKDIGLTTYSHFEPISLPAVTEGELKEAITLLQKCLKTAENCELVLTNANEVQLDPEAFDRLLCDDEEPTSQQKVLFDVISNGDKKLCKLIEIYYDCIISLAQGVERFINGSYAKK